MSLSGAAREIVTLLVMVLLVVKVPVLLNKMMMPLSEVEVMGKANSW